MCRYWGVDYGVLGVYRRLSEQAARMLKARKRLWMSYRLAAREQRSLPQAFQTATKTRVGEIFASATERWPAESSKNLCNGSSNCTTGLDLTERECVQEADSPSSQRRLSGNSAGPKTNRKRAETENNHKLLKYY